MILRFDPILTAMPVPHKGEPSFVTFKVFELILDDGPEQGYLSLLLFFAPFYPLLLFLMIF